MVSAAMRASALAHAVGDQLVLGEVLQKAGLAARVLGDLTHAAAWAQGAAMTLQETIDFALAGASGTDGFIVGVVEGADPTPA